MIHRHRYDLNLGDIAEVWRRGSVIASWLLDLTADALAKDSKLAQFEGQVSDSGEGRWTIKAAIDEGVPVSVLTTALHERFAQAATAHEVGIWYSVTSPVGLHDGDSVKTTS
jgi:6-phosphogluconate dehydrogenase